MNPSRLGRGLAILAIAALAVAVVSPAFSAAPLTKAKVKKIAKKEATKVFDSKIGTAKAGDSDKLDGQDSTALASRVASAYVADPPGSGNFILASTTITVPANGYLVLNGIANIDIGGGTNDFGSCLIEVNGDEAGGFSEYVWTLDSVESDQDHCTSHATQSVTPGTYTVDLRVSGAAALTTVDDGRVTALYVPFGPTGARP